MSYRDLRGFLDYLTARNNLQVVDYPVSTELEITEVHRRVLAKGGPALLFNKTYNSSREFSMPVLANLFGTKERIAWGLGVEPEGLRELGKTLAFLRQPEPPGGWKEAWQMLPLLRRALNTKPKEVNKAPCQEIVLRGDEIDLSLLPIQSCWPEEPAPLITWPLVVTLGPSKEKVDNFNLGIYRMQVVAKNATLMRWLKTRGGAGHYHRWRLAKKGPFPVAAVIGSDPATILAAVTPIPDNLSEYQFSGLLANRSIELVNCVSVPLKVPANAEIVLEGYLSEEDPLPEGPYGDHTGYYNSVELFPKFELTAITMRRNPIYLTTYTGRPSDEPSILGEALNELLIPLLTQQFPEIVDFYLPPEGCSYRVAIAAIKKSYPGQARRVIMGVLSFLRQFMYSKFVIVVDDDINIRDWREVIWAISTNVDPERDVEILRQTPIDYLDFASPLPSLGSKLGLDATTKIYPETTREWGKKIYMDPKIIELVNKNWEKYGLVI